MAGIHTNLKELRIEKGFTQEQVADKIGLTRQAISGYESGKRQPGIDILMELAKIYEVDFEDILYGTKESLRSRKRIKVCAFWVEGIFLSLQMLFGLLHTLADMAFIFPASGTVSYTPGNEPPGLVKMLQYYEYASNVELVQHYVLIIGFLVLLIMDLRQKSSFTLKTKLMYCGSILGGYLIISIFWGIMDLQYSILNYIMRGIFGFGSIIVYILIDLLATAGKKKKKLDSSK